MRKIFELEDRFATGEPTIQLVMLPDGRGGRIFEKRAFDSAADSPAYEYLKTVTPKDGHSIVLVNALGAYEAYDDNRNGDAFPDRPVKVGEAVRCGHKSCQAGAWVAADEVLSKHYKTFEKFGGIYKHHVNKDPSKSLGKVLKAVWNPKMQRVELLLEIVNDRDQDLAKKIADGEYPAVSMGCHVKYDVCSICGHRAPTRKDYCEHARNKMRQVLSNGEKVCVHNPSPRFFDISFVFRPADPTGFMLKKVASAYELWSGPSAKMGEVADEYEQKIADARKLGDIRKRLLGQVAAARQDDVDKYRPVAKANAKSRRPAEDKDIAKLARYPLSQVLATFSAKNAALSTSDVARLFLKKAGVSSPDWLLDRVVAMQPILEAGLARAPSIGEKTAALLEMTSKSVNASLFNTVEAWVEKYAGLSDFGSGDFYGSTSNLPIPGAGYYAAAAPPRTDVLTITDPYSGHVYQTTRGAAQDARKSELKHKLFGTALLSTLYGAGLYHGAKALFRPKIPTLALAPIAIGLGAGTYDKLRELGAPRNPYYITDQGIRVPGGTEFVKAGGVSGPTYLDKVAFDVLERVPSAQNPQHALHLKIARHAPESAIASFLLADGTDEEKAAALCEDLEYNTDGVAPAQIDLTAFGDRVGTLLLS